MRRVVDGDTIQLTTGVMVRYIGLDAPEVRRREEGRWVEDLEPFAREATQANRRLVEGRTLTLEYDVQRQDRFGRTLAYAYVEGVMVNEALLHQGWGRVLLIPPDLKYAARLRAASEDARRHRRGLWNDSVCRALYGAAPCEALGKR